MKKLPNIKILKQYSLTDLRYVLAGISEHQNKNPMMGSNLTKEKNPLAFYNTWINEIKKEIELREKLQTQKNK